ncbi:hypothetical protein HanXRQr2_Chr10g0440981 [Helianthus annuus]|uniref:Uncharacterized protein n=1 Tax=Helianthus annuus TaxID=4232 RepID=A0A9K3N4Q3_HELAN|nr:hypothetical protein HanXRQr2_Chr10g0440981 [Helianthus annuus]
MESFRQLLHASRLTSPRQSAIELAVSLPCLVEKLKKPKPELVVGRMERVVSRCLW